MVIFSSFFFTQHFRPFAEQGAGLALPCVAGHPRHLGMVLHQSIPLVSRRLIICCQLGVSPLWERSQLSFGSRISAKKLI